MGISVLIMGGLSTDNNDHIKTLDVFASETLYHSENFNSTSNFSTTTNYQTDRTNIGPDNFGWDFLPGTVSTSGAVDVASAHLRGYSNNQSPRLETVFAIPNLTKVVFTYKSDSNISVLLSFSTDNRDTWSTTTSFAQQSSSTTVTYTVNVNGQSGNSNVRWQMLNGGSSTGGSAELIIDNIEFYYLPSITLSSISSSGTPSTTTYYVGESFSISGLTITANYSDGSSSNVTDSPNLTITPSTFLSTETTSVSITYTEGGITSDPIVISGLTVLNKVLNSISVNNASTHQTSFAFEEPFSSDGLIIDANYNSGLEEVTSGFTVTGVNTSVLGNQTATVTLDGQTTTYTISVTNIGAGFGTDLIFSEYIEGSSNNKYIEIFNPTNGSIDLSGYKLRVFSNGALTASNDVSLSGSIASLSTKVYQNSGAALSLPAGVTADNNAAVNFNGDDALGLWKVSTSTYVDIFGKIGDDPGSAWSSGDVSTENKTLRRKSTVVNGVSTSPETFDPSLEWEQFDIDTASGLGTHSVNSVNATTQAEAYRDFLEDYETCTVYTNEQITTLVNEYVAMVDEAKTTFASLTLEDYSSTDYANNGNSYSGLTKTETVNALAKLDAIIAFYNAANPGNTVSRSVMNVSGSLTKPNEVIDHSFQSLIMFMLISFSGVLILKKKIQPY